MKQLKDKELLREAKAVHDLTEFERMKLNKNKTYIQERKAEQIQNWKKNQEVMLTRKLKESQLEEFLTTRMKGTILKENEVDHTFHKESMDYFNINCQKLGVELKHDPERKIKRTIAFLNIIKRINL